MSKTTKLHHPSEEKKQKTLIVLKGTSLEGAGELLHKDQLLCRKSYPLERINASVSFFGVNQKA